MIQYSLLLLFVLLAFFALLMNLPLSLHGLRVIVTLLRVVLRRHSHWPHWMLLPWLHARMERRRERRAILEVRRYDTRREVGHAAMLLHLVVLLGQIHLRALEQYFAN